MTQKMNARLFAELCSHLYSDIIASSQTAEARDNDPMGFLLKADGTVMALPLFFADDTSKAISINLCRTIYQAENCVAYCFISEAWMSAQLEMRPSQDPEKVEVFIIDASHRDAKGPVDYTCMKDIKTGKILHESSDDNSIMSNIRLDVETMLPLPNEEALEEMKKWLRNVPMLQSSITEMKEAFLNNDGKRGPSPSMH